MRYFEDLQKTLDKVDGRGYKAYNDIKGSYVADNLVLVIEYVQRDPFASPSKILLEIMDHDYPYELFSSKIRKIALEDYLARNFQEAINKIHTSKRGSGKSGDIRIDVGGPEVLERSCVNLTENKLEIRFTIGLPAQGRRILGNEAKKIFMKTIPQLADSCHYINQDQDKLKRQVETCEDASHIRGKLKEKGLVAFIADGSVLPRVSGVSDRPLTEAIRFKSPESLKVVMKAPHHGLIGGMGIPQGVTLIVGGGYHGKSTLLQAVELGIYNHVPGDGREMVVTRMSAVKIRAEDGRNIQKTDISSFIHQPPLSKSTEEFSTTNASGSTSQAANIIEALEAGSKLLLFDEDTSATNFMIRDHRMQVLVKKEKEPITPFIDRVQELYQDLNVSTILVMGGSGDYFDVADTIIMMDNFLPHNVTDRALQVARNVPTARVAEAKTPFKYHHRRPLKESIKPYRGRRIKLDSRGWDTILLGRESIDLSQWEQLVDSSQTRALSYTVNYATKYMDGQTDLQEILDRVEEDIDKEGLDMLAPPGRSKPHNLAWFRRHELAAALNRLRSLVIN